MRSYPIQLAFYGAVCLLLLGPAFAANDLKPEEVLQKHLDSIGTAAARAAAKSRVVEGTSSYQVLVGGAGVIHGNAVMVSEGRRLQMRLKIVASRYNGEKFLSDGNKTFVEGTYEDHTRSELGEFLRGEDFALREGLMGGVLSTAWPLLDLDTRKGKLKYEGRKKIDGTELEAVSYHPKKNTDLDITLYFEPETFRHVRTVYSVSLSAGLAPPQTLAVTDQGPAIQAAGSSDIDTARRQQTRYRLEERFGDFKTADGLTLPSHYELRFTEELPGGFTKSVQWLIDTTRVLNNVTLDPRNFQIP
jgi:hypothetical protein